MGSGAVFVLLLLLSVEYSACVHVKRMLQAPMGVN
jgi:hypothetical protein